MHKSALLLALALVSAPASAATIRGGRVNVEKRVIELDVTYGGGCAVHQFKLKMGLCRESMPVQCDARLIDATLDRCEKRVIETIELSLAEEGLSEAYFSEGYLTITGDNNSQVTIQLP